MWPIIDAVRAFLGAGGHCQLIRPRLSHGVQIGPPAATGRKFTVTALAEN
jgi:hypothetical protein